MSLIPAVVIAELDRSVLGGILFGIGAFNTCASSSMQTNSHMFACCVVMHRLISILPAIVLKLVAFLGFPSDREKVRNTLF